MPAPTENPLLARLARVNPTTVFLAGIAFVLVALFAPGIIGGALLLLLAIALGVLATVTWAAQPPAARAIRLVILVLLVGAALGKIF
jgi:energy-coupling factor transporter transmembrane protein EcfT